MHRDKSVVLMRGHGITAVGTSVENAGLNTIMINEVAEMNYKAYMLGDPRPIDKDELEAFASAPGGGGRGRAADVPGRPLGGSAWETYKRMTDA